MSRAKKIAIANRGEVAVRIIRAAQELGYVTALLHSEADQNSVAYRQADENICIGPSPVSESYLNIERNILAAKAAGADFLHPGFGFLSENADFAEACLDNRIGFIGPTPDSIRLFGDKISAKHLVEKAGGKTVPGYDGEDQSVSKLISEAERIGYPVIVKAAAGGGGRGMRIIESTEKAIEAIDGAKREAKNAFGNDKVFLEKYLDRAKHIEVQVFGDAAGNIYHLYERECSVQRRHQKVIEEAGAAKLDALIRQRMLAVAVEIAQQAKYKGAGTIEFLYQDGEFYFLEMNTRLQVEHPVTELVVGVDLVKAQINTAAGQSLLWTQQDLIPRGHAIECRLYAEDSFQSGVPSTGILGECHFPQGPGRRFDYGFEAGDEITSFYDSMIAKVIVWDESRARAIRKMKQALQETIVFGVKTNIPYLQEILAHRDFVDGTMTTQFISKYFPRGLTAEDWEPEVLDVAEKLKLAVPAGNAAAGAASEVANPWLQTWRSK